MNFKIVVYTKDVKLEEKLSHFYKNRQEEVSYDNNGIGVILKLITNQADALFLDMDNDCTDYFKLIDILNRMYTNLPIVVFNKCDSVDELRTLKKFGVFYSALKPVQENILEDITESIKSEKFEKILITGGHMKSLNIALVLSSNRTLRKSLAHLFDEMDISYIFESKELNGLLRIMSLPLKVVFIEVNPFDKSNMNFIKLVKNLNPKLRVIAISEYTSEGSRITNAGADHCIDRSVLENNTQSIAMKFNELVREENHLEENKIN